LTRQTPDCIRKTEKRERFYLDDEATQTHHSNIVWSNGQLDPWSGGGHYGVEGRDGPLVQKLPGKHSVALNIPKCGHHADLMLSTNYDTAEFKQACVVELEHIKTWNKEHAAAKQQAAAAKQAAAK
jgi:hypothetical protein